MALNFINQVLTDLKVELMDEFDRNFERKAFFDKPWLPTRANRRGSTLMRSGALRRGNRAVVSGHGIQFTNSLPYARIQNEGGVIVVTRKMQKYFWAMYYRAQGGSRSATASRAPAKKPNAEAQYWKSMALKKVGSRIVIRERRFIGHHIQVNQAVKRVVDDNFREVDTYIKSILKR